MKPTEKQFHEKVFMCPTSGCWLWGGGRDRKGYGRMRVDRRPISAHRFSYEIHKGCIPEGMVVDHICRNRACVNPDHLRVCTNTENVMAPGSKSPGAVNALKASCPKCGGDYSIRPCGRRECRRCKRKGVNPPSALAKAHRAAYKAAYDAKNKDANSAYQKRYRETHTRNR